MSIGDMALAQGYNLKLHKGIENLFRDILYRSAKWDNTCYSNSTLNVNKIRTFIGAETLGYNSHFGQIQNCSVYNTTVILVSTAQTSPVVIGLVGRGSKEFVDIKIPTYSGGEEGVKVIKTMLLEFISQFNYKEKILKDAIVYKIDKEEALRRLEAAEQQEKEAKYTKEFKRVLKPFKERLNELVTDQSVLDKIEEETIAYLISSRDKSKCKNENM